MSDLSFRKIYLFLLSLLLCLFVSPPAAFADSGGDGGGSDGPVHTPATSGHPDDFGNTISSGDDDDLTEEDVDSMDNGFDMSGDDDDNNTRPANCSGLNLRFQEFSATSSEVRWNADPSLYSRYDVELRYNRRYSSGWSTAAVPINDGGQSSVWIESYQELVRHSMQTHPTDKYGGENDIRITGRDKYRLKAYKRNGGTCYTGLVENPVELAPLPGVSTDSQADNSEEAESIDRLAGYCQIHDNPGGSMFWMNSFGNSNDRRFTSYVVEDTSTGIVYTPSSAFLNIADVSLIAGREFVVTAYEADGRFHLDNIDCPEAGDFVNGAPVSEDTPDSQAPSEPASAPVTNEVNTTSLNNLRCVTYSRSSAEVLWDNHTSGVTVNGGVPAGGKSHYFGNGDFSHPQSISVEVNGEYVGSANCPAHSSGGGVSSPAPVEPAPTPAEVNITPLNNLRCVTYSRSSAEVLWDNHTNGVTVNRGVPAGGKSHYFGNGDFSLPQSISVEVNGEHVGFANCPAH